MERLDSNTLTAVVIGTALVIGIIVNNKRKFSIASRSNSSEIGKEAGISPAHTYPENMISEDIRFLRSEAGFS